MRLSIYTCMKNALFYDFHAVQMLRHHLPLADEIVVNEGYSTDKTYDAIRELDPKIRIFRSQWGEPDGVGWFTRFKNDARRACTGDWCILLDCDEFIPEWMFAPLRARLERESAMTLPVGLINFYGNYRVYHQRPTNVSWPARKVIIHRNVPEIEVWGDGANVRPVGGSPDWDTDDVATVHHFGFVRNPARLRQKWRWHGSLYSGRAALKLPRFLFNWRPHDWRDPQFFQDLAVYPGPFIQAVRDDPEEFTRDKGLLLTLLDGNRDRKETP